MNYELALKLKEAGFSQIPKNRYFLHVENNKVIAKDANDMDMKDKVYSPTLSELIEACGDDFYRLYVVGISTNDSKIKNWGAGNKNLFMTGLTPEEAVANLWLTLISMK